MKIILSVVAVCVAFVVLASCNSSKQATKVDSSVSTKVTVPKDSLDPALEQLAPEMLIIPINGAYGLSFTAGAGGRPESAPMRAMHSLSSATFAIYSPDNVLLETLTTTDIANSGVMNGETGEASISAAGGVRYTPTTRVMPGTYAVMTLRSANGIYAERMNFPVQTTANSQERALSLSLEINPTSTRVEFVLEVTRNAPAPEGEYRPSGERYRIELENDVGETIWSSSSGKVFTQAIGDVEPRKVGETITYREQWDGRSDLSKSKLEPGRYRVIATIPAKPESYMLREEFTWSGR